jgi:hypothetical protein
VARRERDFLERAVYAVADQAAKPTQSSTKGWTRVWRRLPGHRRHEASPLELLKVKADLERELSRLF